MPTVATITAKSGKVRRALRQEADRLMNGDQYDRADAKRLRAIADATGNTTLARLHDLIALHPTKAAAMDSLIAKD